jgi:CBS domain-containing protein
VGAAQSLRDALSVLLRHGDEALTVVGQDGRPIGRVGFEDIRRVVLDGRATGV